MRPQGWNYGDFELGCPYKYSIKDEKGSWHMFLMLDKSEWSGCMCGKKKFYKGRKPPRND